MTDAAESSPSAGTALWLALYQPDIPQNTGAILRMAACLSLPVAIVEPAGFPTSDRAFRRAGMDYLDHVVVARHASWSAFLEWRGGRRLILATTRASTAHHAFRYRRGDIVLFGRETAGVPDAVRDRCDAAVRIPMRRVTRSLNLAVSAAVVAAEALRQLDAFPED